MAKVINNFVVDHVLRGIMVKKNGEYMWSINQITNPSLNVALSDTAQAVDALGTPIAEFDRGRSAEFSAENSLFDLGLYAAQLGREKEVGGAEDENGSVTVITMPAFEEIEVVVTKDEEGKDKLVEEYSLKNTPKEDINMIYLLNGDGTLGKSYVAGTQASNTEFVYADGKITIPTGLTKEDVLFVMYEYEATSGVAVTANAIDFPKRGKFIMEVLGCDVCDQEELIHAYVEFPNAKLDGNVDYSFTTDGTHPFTIKAMQDYCNKEKVLFRVIIPDEE